MGRPKVKIDWDEVGEMLKCGCDATAIATTLGVSTDTLYTRSKVDNKLDFSAFSQQKRAQGNDLLRRKQFELALNGNVSMLIWLGKNRLAQSDKQEVKAQVDSKPSQDRIEHMFRHAKRVFNALELRPNGLTFDPENPEHRESLRNSIARSIQVHIDLFPENESSYEDWEDAYEQHKEAIWHDRPFQK
jgi:hypothetical protein